MMSDLRIRSAVSAHSALLGKRLREVNTGATSEEDGGAYPELYYPQNLEAEKEYGKKGSGMYANLPLILDSTGNLDYDSIYRRNNGTVVRGKLTDTLQKDILDHDETLQRPSVDLAMKVAKKTKEALNKVIEKKLAVTRDKEVIRDSKASVYYKYKPAQKLANGLGFDTRIIRITEAPVDPLEPPKFKHKKIPRPPPSPPPPILHSPPRKVTAEEQKNWMVPPCISNWKNAKGYTIPLDKRLAADGRGVQDVAINDNFAKLSEALFIADRHAREEVKLRAEMRSRIAVKEREEKEGKLRALAQRAREDSVSYAPPSKSLMEMAPEEFEKYKEREEIRRDKQKQREQQLRLSRIGAETKARLLARDSDRDISEKIALGLVQSTSSKEALFDQRLFNKSQGLSSGFSADDTYNLYDKPLFTGQTTTFSHNLSGLSAFTSSAGGAVAEKIDKILGERKKAQFQGANAMSDAGPVKFEKSEADPFGLEEFVREAKRESGSKKK